VDTVDIVLAVFAPCAVLLVIEMFVSRLWPRTLGPQTVRWVSTVIFGVVAAYVSWHHLSDLLSSRGQDRFLSSIEPLAIDGLAIMATALVLSSRRAKSVQLDTSVDKGAPMSGPPTVQDVLAAKDTATLDSWRAEVTQDITPEGDRYLQTFTTDGLASWTAPEDTPPLGISIPDALPSWLDGLNDRAGGGPSTPAATARPPVVQARVSANRLSPEQRAEVRQLTAVGREHGMYGVMEIRELLAVWYSVSTRTIQRAEVSQ
jgi:hypothetical protein